MDKEEKELHAFLEQQLQWIKEQDHILAKIEQKLHQMKEIGIYAAEYELPEDEISELNTELNRLKQEIHILEKQLQGTVH